MTLHSQVEFTVEAPKEINVGQPFEVSFIVKNGEPNNPKFPKFDGFKGLTGPSFSSSTTIINGRRSSTVGYSFTLIAEQKGNKMIGMASVDVERKTYYSGGVNLNVITPKDASKILGGGDPDGWAIMAVAEPSKHNLYVGEQMIMHYKFYYGEQLGVSDRPTLPAFKDFFVKRMDVNQQELPSIMVKGRNYNGVLFDAVALFPQTTGDRIIPPATYYLEKQEGGRDPFNPFTQSVQKSVQTNSSKISVKQLPLYDKKDFSGVVGKYSIESKLLQTNISTDQSATIRLKIQGNGDAMQLSPPTLNLDPTFEVFPPKQISNVETFDQNKLNHVTEYEYVLRPKKSGTYPVQVSFVSFDPDLAKYVTTTKQLGNLAVSQGSKKAFTQFYSGEDTEEGQPIRYAILLGSLALAGLIYFYKRPRKSVTSSTTEVDEYQSKMDRLNQRASAKLARAKAFMDNNESVAFFKEVETSINQVVQEKFHLSQEDMTKQRLKEIINDTYKNAELGEDYMGIFTKVDMARYAGSSTQDMGKIYTTAAQFIKDFEGMGL